MRFYSPGFLLLIPLALVLVWWCLARRRRGQGVARFRFSSLELWKRVSGRSLFQRDTLLGLFRVAGVVLALIALARPQTGKKFTETTAEGVDILLALDTSGSMQALDLKIEGRPAQRVDVVKKVAGEFIKKRVGDRIGLVVFAETAFLQCPLTLDHNILDGLLERIHLGMAGDATAVGDAIGIAVKHMKSLKAKSRVVILLTDGASNAGQLPPAKAAELAAAYQVKVYTIGVGIEGDAPFLVDTPFGKRVVYQKADLDEESLKAIAEKTGAKFYRAKDTEELEQIYREIDRLEKSEVKVKEYSEYHERFAWFAFPALLALLGEIVIGQTLLRKVP